MRIEIFQGSNMKWYWHFCARNGKIVADAEAYASKSNALRAAKAVVNAVLKRVGTPVAAEFTKPTLDKTHTCFIVQWAAK